MGLIRHHPSVHQLREGPLVSWDDLCRRIIIVTHYKGCFWVTDVRGRVGAVHSIGQGLHLGAGIGLEGHDYLPGQWTLGRHGVGHLHSHEPLDVRHVGLPAAPGHGVPMPHKKAVPRIQRDAGVEGFACSMHVLEDTALAPVGYFKQDAVVAPLRLDRSDDGEIC